MIRNQEEHARNGIKAMTMTTTTTNTTTIFIILLTGFLGCFSSTNKVEVCNRETQVLNCGGNDVIYIDSARNGRMNKGRCMAGSNLTVACSADVTLYLEHKCSGRRQCSVGVDHTLDNSPHGCHPDLKVYLEIAYSCIPVESPQTKCNDSPYVIRPRERSGFLARVVTNETGIGSSSCPWVIEAKSGQTLALTLLDFGIWRLANQSREGIFMCQIYMTVRDRSGSGLSTKVCGGTQVEEKERRSFYTSVTNSVQIIVNNIPGDDHFLVKYEVLGCPDLSPTPLHSSVDRQGDHLTIRCETGRGGGGGGEGGGGEPIVLTCVDGKWTGPALVNCPAFYSPTSNNKTQPQEESWFGVSDREWLIAVISISATLIVSCLLFFVFARLYKEYLLQSYLVKEKDARRRAARHVPVHHTINTIPNHNYSIIHDLSPSLPHPHIAEIQSTYLTMTTNGPPCNGFIPSDMGLYEEPVDGAQPENTASGQDCSETQATNQYSGLNAETSAVYLALYTDLQQREESANDIMPEDTTSNHHGEEQTTNEYLRLADRNSGAYLTLYSDLEKEGEHGRDEDTSF